MKLKCLDLFCCGGGASAGYARAGFYVTGVDIQAQPGYPFAFERGDAIQYLVENWNRFDFIHASPPCQGYSKHVSSASSRYVKTKGMDEPRLIAGLREILQSIQRPWVIENVSGARSDMNATLVLCGTMFGLPISRHRLFESSFVIEQPEHPRCRGVAKQYAEKHGWEYRDMSCTGKGRRVGTADRWAQILGIEHPMTQHQLTECIPPAYTEHIGRCAMAHIQATRSAQ